jgi:hypothetical protein
MHFHRARGYINLELQIGNARSKSFLGSAGSQVNSPAQSVRICSFLDCVEGKFTVPASPQERAGYEGVASTIQASSLIPYGRFLTP